ncbi:MAG: hypothetical protein GC185_01685 [Alphaproteobacteria bacterium]|nr:hypothetical protein [Alphaproteobacteria bacterium]
MATEKPCKQCQKPVSIWASTCPHCGKVGPTSSVKTVAGGIAAIGLIIGLFVMVISDDGSEVRESKVAAATALHPDIQFGSLNPINHAAVGCHHKERLKALHDYINEGDQKAFDDALAEAVFIRECTLFKKGDKVYAEDVNWHGQVKVRRPGETTFWWTDRERVGAY